MSEMEIRRRMQEARENPPTWKRELLRGIDELAQRAGALDVFRGHIRNVAKALVQEKEAKERDKKENPLQPGQTMSWGDYQKRYYPKDLLGPGDPLTIAEKYFILAAFHDALCEAERMSPIMPEEWKGDCMRQVNHQGQQTEWFRTPDFAPCCMYLNYSGRCADLPDEQLQPAVLQQSLEDLRADLEPVVSRKLLRANLRWFVALIGLESLVVCGAWVWGEGANLWEKVRASWEYFGGVFAAWFAGFVLLSKFGRLLVKRMHKFRKGDPD